MIVHVGAAVQRSLADYCEQCYPAEACGFVLGDLNGQSAIATAHCFVPVRNAARHPNSEFAMDPAELVALLAKTPKEQLLGIFHSHPGSPPIPSEADLQSQWHTLPTYWIVSLHNRDQPETAVYGWYVNRKQKGLLRLPGSPFIIDDDG
jgi:[CysO sulfur-carrier protein]-S-L-cysteine hydrolase